MKRKTKIKLTGTMIGVVLFILIYIKAQQAMPPIKNEIAVSYMQADHVKASDFKPRGDTLILDQNGKTIKKLSTNHNLYIPYSKINPNIIKALVATEDRSFYHNKGVDITGIMRAFYSNYIKRSGYQGGSTITQQLVKNMILKDSQQTFSRKIQEMVISQEISKKFSKEKILEFYLNNVYLTSVSQGIGAAAITYFNTPQNELNLSQIALLVGLINNPTIYNPITHPKAALYRRNIVLHNMYIAHIINNMTYQKAIKQPIKLNLNHKYYQNNDTENNYALSYAINNATKDLMASRGFNFKYIFTSEQERSDYENNYATVYKQCRQDLMAGGYTIRTSINLKLQQAMEKIANKVMNGKTTTINGKTSPEIASTIIDNKTGDVLAVIGGYNSQTDSFNRAFQGFEQPGSAAKPIVAYAEAFERGYGLNSSIVDSPINGIHNWYNGYTNQPMSLQYALNQSVNTVPYKLALQDKKHSYFNNLGKMEFSQLTSNDNSPIIALGGFTRGVTTTQMASAYSSFSRNGIFIAPQNINFIVDNNSNRTIYINNHSQTHVYTPQASQTMIKGLQDVVRSGLGKNAVLNNYRYTAGKTGTTDNDKDAYFVGMTKGFTIANWLGDDKHRTDLSYDQTQLPLYIFKDEGQYLIKHNYSTKDNFAPASNIHSSSNDNPVWLSKWQQAQAKDAYDWNQKRLSSMDYRIIYHLSKSQEKNREIRMKNAIQYVKSHIQLTSLNDYGNKLGLISQLTSLNTEVKHMAVKQANASLISQLRQQLLSQQLLLSEQKDSQASDAFEHKKQAVINQWNKNKQKVIDKAKSDYQDLLNQTQQAYNSNANNKNDLKNKLTNQLNLLRSLGVKQDNPTITVNDDNNNH